MTDFKKTRKFGTDKRPGKFVRRAPSRSFDKPLEMHQATCNKCGATCEVPFRPNGKKPVYCRNCFVRDDAQSEMRGFDKRGFDPSRSPAKSAPDATSLRLRAIERELNIVHSKIDTLIARLDSAA